MTSTRAEPHSSNTVIPPLRNEKALTAKHCRRSGGICCSFATSEQQIPRAENRSLQKRLQSYAARGMTIRILQPGTFSATCKAHKRENNGIHGDGGRESPPRPSMVSTQDIGLRHRLGPEPRTLGFHYIFVCGVGDDWASCSLRTAASAA